MPLRSSSARRSNEIHPTEFSPIGTLFTPLSAQTGDWGTQPSAGSTVMVYAQTFEIICEVEPATRPEPEARSPSDLAC